MVQNSSVDRLARLIDTLKPQRRTRVVDIGANPLDDPPYKMLMDIDGCDVWGFEPQKDAFEKLISQAGPREHYLPYAVGNGERGTLHICKSSGFTSMFEPNAAAFRYLGRFARGTQVLEAIDFETSRLDDLDLPQVDLVKIDVQGSEKAVFHYGHRMLAGGVAVITEVAAIPLYKDQPLLDAQMAELAKSDYYLHKFMTFKSLPLRRVQSGGRERKILSQLIDGDAVFIRALLNLDEQDVEWLKHLAILADGVFHSYDLAVLVLELLVQRGVISRKWFASYVAQVVEG